VRLEIKEDTLSYFTETEVRDSLWIVLDVVQPKSVQGLKKAVTEGRIQGSAYIDGAGSTTVRDGLNPETVVGCVLGQLCILEDCGISELESEIDAYVAENEFTLDSGPIEAYVRDVQKGDTPQDSPELANVSKWIEQYMTDSPEERQ
jgi:hypothetical protein